MIHLSLFNTRGVIIKAQDYKENDKLVWIYTEELGKVTAIVKGAKKSKSKFFALTLPLCFSEYSLYKGKSLYILQEGKIINSFQTLLDKLDKLTYSSYICELIDISCSEEESNKYIFKDFVTVLYLLSTDALDYELLIRAFEIRLLENTGYRFSFDRCMSCGKKINASNYISLSNLGGICDTCSHDRSLYISKGAFNTLKYLKSMNMDKIYRLNVDKKIKEQIEKVTSYFICNNYSKKPKSLEMLKYIKE